MGIRAVGLMVLGLVLSVKCIGQRIVDQTSIDPEESVYLFPPMSLEAFVPQVGVGEVFPDFQTFSTEGVVISLDDIYEDALAYGKVPIVVFGRPSCNILRRVYSNVLIPLVNTTNSEFQIYHLAPSVEAHATNGYLTPYYRTFEEEQYPSPQIPSANTGLEFDQAFTGEELLESTENFAEIMSESGSGNESDYDDVLVLLDSPEGGFAETFEGPTVVWVLNPLNQSVASEQTTFPCSSEHPLGNPCFEELNDLVDVVNDIAALMQVSVGIPQVNYSLGSEKLLPIDLLGRMTQSATLYYNQDTGSKVFIPAQ